MEEFKEKEAWETPKLKEMDVGGRTQGGSVIMAFETSDGFHGTMS